MSVPAGLRIVGVGLDSVDVERLDRVVDRRPRLLERLFTDRERSYAEGMARPGTFYAGRFAAKEATMKSLGVGLGALDWWDVEVIRLAGGRPELVVTGRAAALADALGVAGWHLSITHTATVASAIVAAVA